MSSVTRSTVLQVAVGLALATVTLVPRASAQVPTTVPPPGIRENTPSVHA